MDIKYNITYKIKDDLVKTNEELEDIITKKILNIKKNSCMTLNSNIIDV